MAAVDDAIASYLRALDQAEDEFLDDIEQMEDDGFSTMEILAFLAALDMSAYFIEDLGMSTAINSYVAATESALVDLPFLGSISERQLMDAQAIQRSVIIKYTDSLGERIRSTIAEGVAGHTVRSDIKTALQTNVSVDKVQVKKIVGTQISSYEQMVLHTMAENLTGEPRYSYLGPLDRLTRPLCVQILGAGPMTKAQIEAQFPGCWHSKGGNNCRHLWAAVSPTKELLGIRIEAQKKISALKSSGRFKKALTPKQYYETRKTT